MPPRSGRCAAGRCCLAIKGSGNARRGTHEQRGAAINPRLRHPIKRRGNAQPGDDRSVAVVDAHGEATDIKSPASAVDCVAAGTNAPELAAKTALVDDRLRGERGEPGWQ